jgi:FMN phosphatase YigB (HAD superfamily)
VITTLLLDLDNTLVGNDMEEFIPTYLNRLGAYMADMVPSDLFITELLQGTRAMMENLDPAVSLERVFAETFYPSLGLPESVVRSQIGDFYTTVFPTLQTLTTYRPEAEQLVQSVLEAGIEVVIATSPLFPRTAIEERLAWAGVPAERYNYALITSYEYSHFSKPHLEYYAEILGRLGRPAHQTAMIGNDPENDIAPAQSMGMSVFHVSRSPLDAFPGGQLIEVIPWLERIPNQDRPEAVNHSKTLVARLRGYLAALISMTTDLDEKTWTRRPTKGEWAPIEIVCHLRDVEQEVTLPRVETILTETDPHLSPFDTDRWAEERDYIHQSSSEALADFIHIRKQTISLLTTLNMEDWSRSARHSLFGPTTLSEVVNIATEHDLLHLAQMRSTLKSKVV